MKKEFLLVAIGVVILCSVIFVYSWFRVNVVYVPHTEVRIVTLGDSLTAGYGVDENQRYPNQLHIYLEDRGYGVDVQNSGVTGDNTKDVVHRLDSVDIAEGDFVIVLLGGNNMLRRLPPSEMQEDLVHIVSHIQDLGAYVLLSEIKPKGPLALLSPGEYEQAFGGVIEETKAVLIKDVLGGVMDNDEYMQDDRIHPNAEGYTYMVNEHIGPALIDTITGVYTGR